MLLLENFLQIKAQTKMNRYQYIRACIDQNYKGLHAMLSIFSKNKNEQLQEVLDQAFDAIVTIDHNNHIIYFNHAAELL